MNELAAAFMAKLVSGNLQVVDEFTTHRSATSGPANKLNAHNFVNNKSVQDITAGNTVVEQHTHVPPVVVEKKAIVHSSPYIEPQPSVADDSKKKTSATKSTKQEISISEDFLAVFKSIDKSLKSIASNIKEFNKSK